MNNYKGHQCAGCKYFNPDEICKRRKVHFPLSTNVYIDTDVSNCYVEENRTITLPSILTSNYNV